MPLPEIITEPMELELGEQLTITLFPEKQGQPEIDVIKVSLTQIEGKKTDLYFTPCEALELAAGLTITAQHYLYNQEQYRKEILMPRVIIAETRNDDKCPACDGSGNDPEYRHGSVGDCLECKGTGRKSTDKKDNGNV
jgi:hypothetical protein